MRADIIDAVVDHIFQISVQAVPSSWHPKPFSCCHQFGRPTIGSLLAVVGLALAFIAISYAVVNDLEVACIRCIHLLPTTYHLPPTTYLHTTHCPLPTSYCHYLLPNGYCQLPTIYYLPPAAYNLPACCPMRIDLPRTTSCLRPAAYYLLPTAHYPLPTTLLPTTLLTCCYPPPAADRLTTYSLDSPTPRSTYYLLPPYPLPTTQANWHDRRATKARRATTCSTYYLLALRPQRAQLPTTSTT